MARGNCKHSCRRCLKAINPFPVQAADPDYPNPAWVQVGVKRRWEKGPGWLKPGYICDCLVCFVSMSWPMCTYLFAYNAVSAF